MHDTDLRKILKRLQETETQFQQTMTIPSGKHRWYSFHRATYASCRTGPQRPEFGCQLCTLVVISELNKPEVLQPNQHIIKKNEYWRENSIEENVSWKFTEVTTPNHWEVWHIHLYRAHILSKEHRLNIYTNMYYDFYLRIKTLSYFTCRIQTPKLHQW